MTSISSSDAFLIFGKWREDSAQLQITFRRGDQMGGSPARILETLPDNEKISAEIISNGESKKWTFSLIGTSSQYGEPSDSAAFPEFAERAWAAYLAVAFSDGTVALFAERQPESIHTH